MQLYQRIVNARKQKGLTQEQLAELTNVTVRTIQRIETGNSVPRAYTLKALATVLDIDLSDLLTNSKTGVSTPESIVNADELEESRNFLRLLCLSCFSYLIIPFLHFLIPRHLLRKSNEQNPVVIALARKIILMQIYWLVSLHLLLFCTLVYNFIVAGYYQIATPINYLVPVFAMYLINAIIIVVNLIRLPKSLISSKQIL